MKKVLSLFFVLWMVNSASAEIKTEEIQYSTGGAKLTGFLAYDDAVRGKRPGVLVVHEWWGRRKNFTRRESCLRAMKRWTQARSAASAFALAARCFYACRAAVRN